MIYLLLCRMERRRYRGGREGWREMGATKCLLMINKLLRLQRARWSPEAQRLLYSFYLNKGKIYLEPYCAHLRSLANVSHTWITSKFTPELFLNVFRSVWILMDSNYAWKHRERERKKMQAPRYNSEVAEINHIPGKEACWWGEYLQSGVLSGLNASSTEARLWFSVPTGY